MQSNYWWRAYYKDLITHKITTSVPLEVEFINERKGKGLFTRSSIPPDATIFKEKPLVSIQHVENRSFAWNCPNCLRFLGSIKNQAERLSLIVSQMLEEEGQEILLQQFKQTFKPNSIKVAHEIEVIPCSQGCGEFYCSQQCRSEAWERNHRFLCVGLITDANHPLVKFKEHAILHNELFLLAASAIASIIQQWQVNGCELSKALRDWMTFQRRHWSEIAQFDTDLPGSSLQKLLVDSLTLLQQAFAQHIADAEFQLKLKTGAIVAANSIANLFTVDFYSLLLGLFEINNNAIEIPSTLQLYLESIPRMNGDDAREAWEAIKPLVTAILKLQELEKTHDNEDEEDMLEENAKTVSHGKQEISMEINENNSTSLDNITLEQALEKDFIFTPCYGFGLFPLAAVMNHSCCPNAVVRFDEGNFTACVSSLADNTHSNTNTGSFIPAESELVHSYIDNDTDLQSRTHELRAYGFQCDCQKCISERH